MVADGCYRQVIARRVVTPTRGCWPVRRDGPEGRHDPVRRLWPRPGTLLFRDGSLATPRPRGVASPPATCPDVQRGEALLASQAAGWAEGHTSGIHSCASGIR